MPDLALHIPNGIIGIPTSLAFGLAAALAVGACVAAARRGLDERLVPLAGLATAFIFAAQMLNFPVAAGVSGHLLGGALAAALLGPGLGVLCVTVVIGVQALLFADGGVSALGLNVVNMAVISTFAAYGVIALALKLLGRTRVGLTVAVFAASVVSVVAAAAGFLVEFWIGGEPIGQSFGAVAAAIGSVHVLIGIGEGVITAAAVVAVALARPDLVYALKGARIAEPAAVKEIA
ncbi:energy-coupling factor ABC transporter permease [Glycomyces sp. L485]|uniref:energy-coupling factor ABC transporter permease n=1 Tax=Glycomyces sp. L485 TaxID=2909235 RepID=UPI001F4A8890|nr:energy-coupling factor ABC transporter permease [Glycomyces sp. L485]MCH7230679.1 energy-coupling factor ABC transporter permease [Glycomyces sp. L485]